MTSKPGPSSFGMGTGIGMAAGPGIGTTTQEYSVRVPKDRKKKLSMMKFATGLGVDFTKLGSTSVKMERENNLKEYKTANDLDTMPKSGAGSEFGRDQKEEARRRKYGIILKKYNPEEQPWHLKVGSGKQAKKYRGVREGTITENTSYYIFTHCADGTFEAYPVDEWYNFTPMIRYKYLNADEAEEEFSRRDKILNYFMLKKRMKNEDKDGDLDEEEKTSKGKASKSKKKNKEFKLTDMDDWADLSDDDEDVDDDEDEDREEREKEKKPKKGKAGQKGKKRVKNAKQNSDDEAIEESDEGDYDNREVDYISDSSSSGMSEPEEKEKKYEEKGVAEEDGLRNILNSDEEEEEEEENKEEEENEEEEKKEEEKPKEKKGGSDSSSSSSDSDSDIDKDEKITSALLMQKERMEKKKLSEKGDGKAGSSTDVTDSKPMKRKAEGDGPPAKKSKKDLSGPAGSSSDGITEERIRHYLQRKPMTTKDLLQKFRSKKLNMTIEQMSNTIAHLLKRINPVRTTINKKLYLSLKKPE